MSETTGDYTTSRRWRPPVAHPFAAGDCGIWCTYTWEHDSLTQHGAVLVPEKPAWRSLFDALDTVGATDQELDVVEEADALVAVCWRYGSYIHFLTFGEFYPPLRQDINLSRIGDMEMMRIQIETSAALANCLKLRRKDKAAYTRRLRAALQFLPILWRHEHSEWLAEQLHGRARRWQEQLADVLANHPPDLVRTREDDFLRAGDPERIEANGMVNSAYRNGSGIEDLHAGHWNPATEVPGYVRLYGPEIRRIASEFARNLAWALASRAQLDPEHRATVNALQHPTGWSIKHETSIVAFSGLSGGAALDQRLLLLSRRYPSEYRVSRIHGTYDGYKTRFTPDSGSVVDSIVLTDVFAPRLPLA